MRNALATASLLLLAGCFQELRIDDPDGSPPPWDGGFSPPAGKCVLGTGVDLLFVIDNSNSMEQEQASLAVQLPFLVSRLVDPPDEDLDGRPDWVPVSDLQVGVVTTDMGTGGFTVSTCTSSSFGDDGALRTVGSPDAPECDETYPTFVRFDPDDGTPVDAFARDVGCVARVGTGGCGFEQPLEAALKALTPSTSDVRFFENTRGQADDVNAGFVRDDSVLAVVVVTDEEDCSAADPGLYDPASTRFVADLNLRCFTYADEAVHPLDRYVEGLTALRAGRPDLLAFALIAGVPTDLVVPSPTDDHYRNILDDSRMEERIDPVVGNRLVPSCDEPGRGLAFPPRRMVQLARRLGASRSTVQSICAEDFAPAAAAISRLVGTRACSEFE